MKLKSLSENGVAEPLCSGLSGLANRRLQPLGHVSGAVSLSTSGLSVKADRADPANKNGSGGHGREHNPFPPRSRPLALAMLCGDRARHNKKAPGRSRGR